MIVPARDIAPKDFFMYYGRTIVFLNGSLYFIAGGEDGQLDAEKNILVYPIQDKFEGIPIKYVSLKEIGAFFPDNGWYEGEMGPVYILRNLVMRSHKRSFSLEVYEVYPWGDMNREKYNNDRLVAEIYNVVKNQDVELDRAQGIKFRKGFVVSREFAVCKKAKQNNFWAIYYRNQIIAVVADPTKLDKAERVLSLSLYEVFLDYARTEKR